MKTKKFILKLLAELLFLAALGNFLGLFTIPRDIWSLKIVLSNSFFSICIGFPAFKSMEWYSKMLDRRIPWLKAPIKRLIYQVAGLTLISGILILLGLEIWNLFNNNVSFSELFRASLPSLKVVYTFVFLSLLLGNAVLFFVNWKKAAVQQEELKRAHLALQYESLKDQVRPHFLFNSLSSLATLINTDAEKATLFVHKLSDVYRYVLEKRDNELVTLKEEVKFLEDYLYMQQIRFGDRLKLEIELDLDMNRMIIPLSLQMLVENAIKHNEISEEKPLVIKIYAEDRSRIVVRNKLQKKEVSDPSLGMGLENLKKQIAFFSDEALLVGEKDGSFMVTIPTFSK